MENLDFFDLVGSIEDYKVEEEENIEEIKTDKKEKIKSTTKYEVVSIISLGLWFEANKEEILKTSQIAIVPMKLRGISEEDFMIITIPSPTKNDPNKRSIILIQNPYNMYTLDFPPVFVKVSPTSLCIISNVKDNIFSKTYNALTQKNTNIRNPAVEISMCVSVDQNKVFSTEGKLLIPYNIKSISKKEFGISMQTKVEVSNINEERILDLLNSKAPIEDIIVKYYPQLQRQSAELKLWKDVVKHLSEKQNLLFDMPHLLQIDKTISTMFSY
jgi:hypothetical protein